MILLVGSSDYLHSTELILVSNRSLRRVAPPPRLRSINIAQEGLRSRTDQKHHRWSKGVLSEDYLHSLSKT